MSVGITFGSIGDLIRVSEIAWSLGKALKDSRGSVKEYKCLEKELETFSEAFRQVVALWQNYENCPELEELGEISQTAATDTIDLLTAFRDKLNRKYGKYLSPSGSGNRVKDAGKKMLWLTEKNDIAELRRKLHDMSQAIMMLTLVSNGKSSRLDAKTQESRSRVVHNIQKESLRLAQKHVTQLEIIERQLDAQAKTSESILTIVKRGTSNSVQVLSSVREIKGMLSGLQMMYLALAQDQKIQRGLGTHWQHDPAVLEDALGNRIRIPLEMLKSWEMFDTWLPMYFEESHLPGARKVARREFAIEDSISGKALTRDREWSKCFLPGKKANMSMLFQTTNEASSCPGCKTVVEGSTKEWLTCTRPDCGIRFRRITERIEVDSQLDALFSPPPKLCILKPLITVSVNPRIVVPEPEDNPGDFRRVQLINKILQFRINQYSTTTTECDPSEESLERQNLSPEQIILASEASLDTEEKVCPLCAMELGSQISAFLHLLMLLRYTNDIKKKLHGLCPAYQRPCGGGTVEWRAVTVDGMAQF